MIIVQYIDIDRIIYPIVILSGITIVIAIIRGIHINKGRKEEYRGDDTISFQWTSKEEISKVLMLPINNNDTNTEQGKC